MSRGLTLLELLIAMALTLLLILGLAQFFTYVGDTVRDGRAIVEMGGDIRNAVRQLREDMNSVTATTTPPLDPASGAGFIELVEGIAHDMDVDADGSTDTNATMQGDVDDILSFTIRSSGQPFTGLRYNASTGGYDKIESPLAEVVWFTTFKDTDGDGACDALDEPRFLVRRHLLIVPNATLELPGPPQEFFQHNDISARYDSATSRWIPNSLSDLTQRENRFIHTDLDFSDGSQNGLRAADAVQSNAYMPNPVQLLVASAASLQRYLLQGDKLGEDLVLPNLLAFDVRVYDPEAPMYADSDGEAALQPGDPGFEAATQLPMAQPEGWGAYVDLYFNRYGGAAQVASQFSGRPRLNPFAANPFDPENRFFTWDTWSTHYEKDGHDQFGDASIEGPFDWAFNDEDDPRRPPPLTSGNGIVDDIAEFETTPPYLAAIRGVQVRVRMYEPGTRQTRQATVVGSF